MTFQRGVLAAVLAVIALALVLDRQEPYREPRAAAPQPAKPASLTPADVKRIARRVERIRRLRFARPVQPLFVSRAEAVRMQEEAAVAELGSAQEDEEALKLLGLMRPSESLREAFTAVEREQVLGFYDDSRKRLVVVRDRRASRALLEITLAHELVHALEDQRFGLRSRGAVSDDRALAETTLAEGTATEAMVEYAVRHFGIADALSVFESADSGSKLPRYVEDTLIFPYLRGLDFVERFRGDSENWKAIDNVIRFRRPRTVEQVIHLEKYAVNEHPVSLQAPDLGLALGEDWRRLGLSSVSELDLRELFKIVGHKANARAATGWGGGRFELWRRGSAEGCASPCIDRDVGLMRLAWDTGRDRREGERALGAAFEKGLGGRRLPGSPKTKRWSSRGGVIAVAGDGTHSEIVFAPDAGTAARVLALVA